VCCPAVAYKQDPKGLWEKSFNPLISWLREKQQQQQQNVSLDLGNDNENQCFFPQMVGCLCLLPASSSCHPSGYSTAAASRPTAALNWGFPGQHAGTPPIRPDPTRSSNVLQGKLFSLSKASCGAGENVQIEWISISAIDSFLEKLFSSNDLDHLFVQVVTALGKVWHPEHFVCTECETELGSRNFFEKDGRPYCESDYFTLFSPHCAQCNKPILNVRHSDMTVLCYFDKKIVSIHYPSPRVLFLTLYRKWSPLWTRTGTQSVSAASSAAAASERKVMCPHRVNAVRSDDVKTSKPFYQMLKKIWRWKSS